MSDAEVEAVWREFWAPTLAAAMVERHGGDVEKLTRALAENRLGPITEWQLVEQMKRELYDLHTIAEVVPQVYSHATGGRMSKATYNDVAQITGVIDEHYEEQAKARFIDAFLDLEAALEAGDDTESALQELLEEMGVTLDEVADAGKERARIRAMLAREAEQRPVETVELPPDVDEGCQVCEISRRVVDD